MNDDFISCLEYVTEHYINPMEDWEIQFLRDCYDFKISAEDAESSLATMTIWTLVLAWRLEKEQENGK